MTDNDAFRSQIAERLVKPSVHMQPYESHSVSPVYDSRLADAMIPGGLSILHLNAMSYANRVWSSIPVLRVDFYELPRCSSQSAQRTVELVQPNLYDRMKEVEDVWTLLGYLVSAGPIPLRMCAAKPFLFNGQTHIAWWGRIHDDGELALVLMPSKTPFKETWREVRYGHFLVRK